MDMSKLLSTAFVFAACMAPGVVHADNCYPTKSCKPDVHGTATTPFTKWSDTYKLLDGKQWDLNGAVIENFVADGISRSGILVERGQSNIIVRNGVLTHSATPNTGSALPVGLAVNDGHDVLFENLVVRGFKMAPVPKHYLNGDCSSGEVKSYNVTFRNTLVSDCSDGGYDFKTKNLRFEEATAEAVDICFRIWGQATASNIYCKDWAKWSAGAAVQNVYSAGGGIIIDNLDLEATPGKVQKVFNMHNPGAYIEVKHCTGNWPADDGKNKLITYEDKASAANTTLKLDASCHLGLTRAPVVVPPPIVTPPVISVVTVCSKTEVPNGNGDATIAVKTPAWLKTLGLAKPATLIAAYQTTPACPFLYTVKG